MKIWEIFGKAEPKDEQNRFGVEIELEGIYHNPGMLRDWRQEPDGSLRDAGREFIFKKPMTLGESENALVKLRDTFEGAGIKPKATNLTSTHIHVDVRDLTVPQFLNFVALLMMVEEDLSAASGEDRKTNYFALSTSESDHRLRELIEVTDDDSFKDFVRRQVRNDVRYCGINFNSIWAHGSLELRYLGGQADPRTVLPWLEFYSRVKDIARHDINFEELYRNISIDGTAHLQRLIEPNFPLTVDNVIEGIRNAQTFILGTDYKQIGAPQNGNGLHEYYMRN